MTSEGYSPNRITFTSVGLPVLHDFESFSLIIKPNSEMIDGVITDEIVFSKKKQSI